MATVQGSVLRPPYRAGKRYRDMQRIATLGLVVWNALMVGWTATYVGGIGDCAHESGWSLTVCEAGRSIGIEIGFPFILGVWIVGSAALASIWLRGRPA